MAGLSDPLLIGLGGAGATMVGALFGWLGTRSSKAPDVQESINKAVEGITSNFLRVISSNNDTLAAMRVEIVSLQRTVEAQSAVISDLEQHVSELTSAMSKAGVTPPPRRRTTKKEST